MFLLLLFGCFSFFFLISMPVYANEQQNKINFEIKAVLPENQLSDKTYYDLKVAPGQEQNLTLKLKNTSGHAIKVRINTNNATTNVNGMIDYSKHQQKMLGNPTFEEMIGSSQAVSLLPFEEKIVSFHLKIPKNGFKGTVLGGFYCYEEEMKNQTKQHKTQKNLVIANRFSYTIGVQLTCTNDKVKPNIQLTKIKPGLSNGYLTIFSTIENRAPLLLSQLSMKATITKKNQQNILYREEKTISLAPRSLFELPINLNNSPLKKGIYLLTIKLIDENGKNWRLQKEFVINNLDEKLNDQAVEVKEEKKDNSLFYFYLLLALCLIIIFGLIIYIVLLKKTKKG
ncbi:DUF916 and DUF3324 domain-containing protein [Melissococcus plutonius]